MAIKNNELFSSVKKGEKQAFRELFSQYYRYLTTIAWRILGEEHTAQDIAQDAFMELWNRRAQLPDNLLVKSYLRQITVNKSINYLKKQKKMVFSADALDTLTKSTVEDLQLIDFDSMSGLITNTVDKLPKKCRIIFSMSRFEEMKHKEIAAQLGISTKTVENQITIALKRIRLALQKAGFLSVVLLFASIFLFKFWNLLGGFLFLIVNIINNDL